MWRPKNWAKNPCENCERKVEDSFGLFCNLSCGTGSAHENYEAGADAMLEALKRKGVFTYGNHPPDTGVLQESGYWVFIPEEVKT